jgi:hypothetical protein
VSESCFASFGVLGRLAPAGRLFHGVSTSRSFAAASIFFRL